MESRHHRASGQEEAANPVHRDVEENALACDVSVARQRRLRRPLREPSDDGDELVV
jgi:hypothetical protein